MNTVDMLNNSMKENEKLVNKGGYEVVASYTETEEEYQIVRNHVGLINYSANGKFKISGEEQVEFVNRLISLDIEYLDIEKIAFSLVINEDGQVIDLVTIYKQEDYILIETSVAKRNEVKDFLMKYTEDSDIQFEDVSESLASIGFEGPFAWKVGQKLIDFDISSLPFQSFVECSWNNEKIIFARTGVTGEYGYKVFFSMEFVTKLWDFLAEQNGEEFKVQAVGTDALNITMLEIRQPNVEFETEGLSIFESCFEWLISFDKEECVAAEAIAQIRNQKVERRIVGFIFDKNEALAIGDSIVVENEEIGSILQVENSYVIGKKVGMAIVADEFAVSGLEMAAMSSENGTKVEIKTASSPYITPKSWSIKII